MSQYRTLPPFGASERLVAEVVRGLMDGKSNNTGTFTLATGGATSTTIYDERIGYDSVILFMPTAIQSAAMYYPYGAFQDSTTQTASSTTAAYAMTFNTTDYSEGVSIASSSHIKVSYSGLYNLQFSTQFQNTDTAIQDVSVWFRKNGSDIAASNSDFSIPNSHGGTSGRLIAALNYFVALQKDDYIEIMWSTTSTQVSIVNIATRTSPTRPSTPSVIATMQYLSPNGYTTNVFESPYVSSRNKGSAVISHPANSTSGKTYDYIVVG